MPVAISDAGWQALTTISIAFFVTILLLALIIAVYHVSMSDEPEEEIESVSFVHTGYEFDRGIDVDQVGGTITDAE